MVKQRDFGPDSLCRLERSSAREAEKLCEENRTAQRESCHFTPCHYRIPYLSVLM